MENILHELDHISLEGNGNERERNDEFDQILLEANHNDECNDERDDERDEERDEERDQENKFDIEKGPFQYEFIDAKKMNYKLLYLVEHHYAYKKCKLLKNGIQTYVCHVDKCKARAELRSNGECFKTARTKSHNHPPELKIKAERASLRKLKEEYRRPISLSIKTKSIFDNHVTRYVFF